MNTNELEDGKEAGFPLSDGVGFIDLFIEHVGGVEIFLTVLDWRKVKYGPQNTEGWQPPYNKNIAFKESEAVKVASEEWLWRDVARAKSRA